MADLFGDPEFWVFVAAVVFLVLVWKPARRALIGGLDDRAARIKEELDAARKLREEAERTLAAYREKQLEAIAEADLIISHARTEAERIRAQAARNLEAALEQRQRLAEERIAQEEAKALAEIRVVAVEVAVSAAREIMTSQLDEGRGNALIDTAIAALPHQLN